ncbi:calcium-translocating P-type ATPase, PMCA-type [Paludicola sp. MB14-C6]|uniref:calcium-translocating P-type ATPase, PMCA-type n=1 Tax=Paludihabitans sp. MB14-C6 TaxID=3070656 RepID=UPI0027DC0650|nr:calcium-translocating P-type ATPase, PMCA-type [Paludicola sp. MB14-C6]WMJ22264.1 calcium-translocating P-type ATPase, PMCA-type [Paludicola sp. MB14-C6]
MKMLDFLDKSLSNEPLQPKVKAKPESNLKSKAIIQHKGKPIIDTHYKTVLGLTTAEAEQLLIKNGKNELLHKKKVSPLKIFLGQYKDIMTIILLICTFVSIIMGEYVEAIAIAVIVLMNGFLGFIQEYRTEKTLEALKNMASPMAKVFRDGVIIQIPSSEIVCGDVVMLEAGDKIPADGVLLHSTSLECDEAMLTGESVPVKKTHVIFEDPTLYNEQCMVFMGCVVTKGHCNYRVTAVGMDTKMGGIASMLEEIEDEQTPLQKRLEVLSKYIAVGCLLICAVVTLTGFLRGELLFDMLITGVSLAVAAVPEGLAAIVTISLALSVSRMVKRNALVRRLHAVETLGCATVICSDKTGTLTQNKMTATRIYTCDGYISAEKLALSNSTNQLLLKAITLCNNAVISDDNEAFGDHTEICLLNLAKEYDFTREKLEESHTRLDEQPFDSTRKRMSVVVEDENRQKYMFVKGGFDILLDRCTTYRQGTQEFPMLATDKRNIEDQNNKMADSALRVICIAYKKVTPLTDPKTEEGLTFIGLIGMIDPPRKEVKGAVLNCYKAGIRTVMITGDHKKTAVAIAKEIGIYHKGDMVLTGNELDRMTADELSEIVNKVTVFARVSPNHKLMIVRALKRHGHIVAMTGDGVNDAPAIKEADIGVSMGMNGTDVTREASEIILLDDNFATLVNAVDEGRSIYNNIRKFIRYLLACNIGEVITMFLGMLMGMPVILFPLQILLVNLVTDGLPAIALGLEPSDKRAMFVPPRRPDESVFSNGLATKIIFRGILIGLATLATFVTLFKMSRSVDVARSGALFALIFAQLIHVFECKSETKSLFEIPFFDNIKLILAAMLSMITLIVVLYIPTLQVIFSTVPLTFSQVMVPILYSLIAPVIVGFFRRK